MYYYMHCTCFFLMFSLIFFLHSCSFSSYVFTHFLLIFFLFFFLTFLLIFFLHFCLFSSYIFTCFFFTFLLVFFLHFYLFSSYILACHIFLQTCHEHLLQTIYQMNACQNMKNTQKNTQNRDECAHRLLYLQLTRATTENTEYKNHLMHHYLIHTQI